MIFTALKGTVFSAFCTMFLWAGWRHGKSRISHFTKKQQKASLILIFWSLLVLYMTLLTFTCDPPVYESGFTPLHTFREIYQYGQYTLAWQLVFNIAMFVPFGLFLPVLFKEVRSASLIGTIGFGFSLFIECTQLIVGRSFDVDDIFCNTIGALTGFGIYILIQTLMRLKARETINFSSKAISLLTAVELVVMACYPLSFYWR